MTHYSRNSRVLVTPVSQPHYQHPVFRLLRVKKHESGLSLFEHLIKAENSDEILFIYIFIKSATGSSGAKPLHAITSVPSIYFDKIIFFSMHLLMAEELVE